MVDDDDNSWEGTDLRGQTSFGTYTPPPPYSQLPLPLDVYRDYPPPGPIHQSKLDEARASNWGTSTTTSTQHQLPAPRENHFYDQGLPSLGPINSVSRLPGVGVVPPNQRGTSMASLAATMGPSLAQAGSNLLGTAISSGLNYASEGRKLQAAAYEAKQARAFQEQQAAIQRLYQEQLAAEQFGRQQLLQNASFVGQRGLQDNQAANSWGLYQKDITNKENALSKVGLPAYLASMPGSLASMPRVAQRGPGKQLYSAQLAGDPTSSPFAFNPIQTQMGWGKLPQQSSY